ncbi:MAG: cation:proton antiporter [Myxococcota bacterium]
MEGNLFQFSLLFGVLGIAAAVSIALRFPVVPLYIVAGVVLGNWLAPGEVVGFLGSLGVVFLLFSMGLEFSLGSAAARPRRFLAAGSCDLLLNFPVGLLAGLLLGWSWAESFFLAGILYMSSSAVVSKCIVEFGRAARPETETILGIMVFEDLVIAVYLVLINALVAGGVAVGDTWGQVGAVLRPLLFVGLLALLAWRLQSPLERLIASRSDESFTLLLFAFVLLIASSALGAGLSEAVGAFLAGIVIGSTRLKERAARTLHPFQTLFAALFFVSFGMGMELGRVGAVALPALMLILLGICTKVAGGFLAGRSAGHAPAQAAVVGLSLVPKGEFSIVIAALAASAGGHSDIEALTGIYVFALSLLGPVGMREADRIWAALAQRLPRRAVPPVG